MCIISLYIIRSDIRSVDSRSERESDKQIDRIKYDYKDENLPNQISNVRVSTDLPDDKKKEFLQKNLNRESISYDLSDISKDSNRQKIDKNKQRNSNESLHSMDKNLQIPNNKDLHDSLNSLYTRMEVKNFFSVYDISAMDEIPPTTTGKYVIHIYIYICIFIHI
jgi:hypothetical protein